MAYKNIEDQRAASKRHYRMNKSKYLKRNADYRSMIRKFIQDKKESSACCDCGVNYPYYVMDFDHLEGAEKDDTINFLSSTGRIGAVKREMEKCELVCANCHRERTHQRRVAKISSPRSSVD